MTGPSDSFSLDADAIVEQFVRDDGFASLLSARLTQQEQTDVITVTRAARVTCVNHTAALDALCVRLRGAGADDTAIQRAGALYSVHALRASMSDRELSFRVEAASQRVEEWTSHGIAPRMSISALAERLLLDDAFARRVGAPMTGQDQADVVLVVREARARFPRHGDALTALAERVRQNGADERAVYRIAALYSAQFLVDDDGAPSEGTAAAHAAARVFAWAPRGLVTRRDEQENPVVGVIGSRHPSDRPPLAS